MTITALPIVNLITVCLYCQRLPCLGIGKQLSVTSTHSHFGAISFYD